MCRSRVGVKSALRSNGFGGVLLHSFSCASSPNLAHQNYSSSEINQLHKNGIDNRARTNQHPMAGSYNELQNNTEKRPALYCRYNALASNLLNIHPRLLSSHSAPSLQLHRGFLSFTSQEKVREYSERRLLG